LFPFFQASSLIFHASSCVSEQVTSTQFSSIPRCMKMMYAIKCTSHAKFVFRFFHFFNFLHRYNLHHDVANPSRKKIEGKKSIKNDSIGIRTESGQTSPYCYDACQIYLHEYSCLLRGDSTRNAYNPTQDSKQHFLSNKLVLFLPHLFRNSHRQLPTDTVKIIVLIRDVRID
jgi:hypothetical protein